MRSYEEYAKLMNTMIIKEDIPDIITEDWLRENLKNNMFRIWGFSFVNLSNNEFDDNISREILDKISFSTKTVFPKDSPIGIKNSMFKLEDAILKLHNDGIDGSGINVAVIDQSFAFVHDELKDALFSYKPFSDFSSNNMHGTIVSSNFVGKTIGVAPKAKLYYFAMSTVDKCRKETIMALKEIYKLNEQGANIRVVSISASGHREIEEAHMFYEIKDKLEKQGCYVIDSTIFGNNFTCVNINDDTGRLFYSEWQKDRIDYFRNKLGVVTGGKMGAFAPSSDNLDFYLYCPESSYSWAIPKLCGLFTLAIQVQPELTFNEFVRLAKASKIVNENGMILLNIDKLFNNIKNISNEKKQKIS